MYTYQGIPGRHIEDYTHQGASQGCIERIIPTRGLPWGVLGRIYPPGGLPWGVLGGIYPPGCLLWRFTEDYTHQGASYGGLLRIIPTRVSPMGG